ncbi:BLUF domain-containing protein [Sediminitomix flava]|uniref:FAD-dependent sensor of blue light n=1 Tax=Sediminitomix flava TaxID=379075 RepID=A0A315ZE04_SEDFL|nr:BLUF domain-containing protein [Sediminitomix flava]PWJ43380.1 FAD-dependent sensor of blue light [Sediminitomix flava]
MIYYLCYSSTRSEELSDDELFEILKKSQTNNADKKISGMLLCSDEYFLQVLEGDEEQVKALYNKISSDERHRHVKMVMEGHVEDRNFSAWSMTGTNITEEEFEMLKEEHGIEDMPSKDVFYQNSHIVFEYMKNFYLNESLDMNSFW